MKLYIDVDREDPYLVTDDGEAVYVEELREEGRDTDYLNQTVNRKVGIRSRRRPEEFEPEGEDLD
ncbi:MAG TPA: hypothetical protein VF960_06405 [Chloroflexota bacterium]